MAKRNKFEEMLERLVNEDREGAEELFHEIVVERSRQIYENLLAEEADEDEDLDEANDEDEDEDLDEAFFGEADPTDDMIDDVSSDMDMGMDMGDDDMDMGDDDMDMGDDDMDMGDDDMDMGDEEGDVEDRITDLEDELEALKAEFEALMGDEEGDDDMDMGDDDMDMGDDDMDMGDDDMDMGDDDMDMGDDDMDMGDDEDEDEIPFKAESKRRKSQSELMREYADKVAPAKMGDNGANAKSIVAGKNDMGGTTANIAKAGTEAGVEANKGKLKGSALSDQTAKDMNTKNVNVPGAKGATKMSAQPGHGAEKKGKPENADKGAGSPLNGAPKRAK